MANPDKKVSGEGSAWWIVPMFFFTLLAFFVVLRSALIRLPNEVMNSFQSASFGSLVALVLLLLQPIADWSLARHLGASRTACRWVFVGGVLASVLLFIPALGLFME